MGQPIAAPDSEDGVNPTQRRIEVPITSTTRRAGILAAAVAAGACVAAPGALGAQVGVAGGTTDLHLAPATAAALNDAGLGLAPIGPATARGARVSFPITGGRIDPETAAGRVAHSGGLAFSAGGATVRLTNFTVRLTSRPFLIAQVGSARVPLLNLDASDARVLRRGPGGVGTWVVRVRATLRAEAAAALNRAFGLDLPAGLPIGRVDLKAQPAQVVLDGGATTLALDAGTAQALTALGVTPGVIAPGTASQSGLSFPVTGGRLQARTFAGQVPHSGGISLTAGGTVVELRNFRINITGRPNLTAQVGDGPARVGLVLDLSQARTGLSGRKAVVRGARVLLSAPAAAALNQAFGVAALAEGLPLGVADVRADVR